MRSVLMGIVFAGLLAGQTPPATTTLAGAVGTSDLQIPLASVTGMGPGTLLSVDREAMLVLSVVGSSANVRRGSGPTRASAHNAAAAVYFGAQNQFLATDPQGACSAGAGVFVTLATGNTWSCTAGAWVQQNGGGGGGGSLPSSISIPGTVTTGLGSGSTGGSDLAVGLAANLPGGNPATGVKTVFFDASNSNHLSSVDSSGTVIDIQGATGAVTAAAPYLSIGGTKYVAATMWPYTALFSGTYTGSGTAVITTGANGSSLFTTSGTQDVWYGTTATTSVEAEVGVSSNITGSGNPSSSPYVGGIWIYDSTNSHIYRLAVYGGTNSISAYYTQLAWTIWNYSGSGNPSFGGTEWVTPYIPAGPAHLRFRVSAGTLNAAYSMDGGQTFTTLQNTSVGTIASGGIYLGNEPVSLTCLSVKVQ